MEKNPRSVDGGGSDELKLLGSWARVKLALHLKGVPYSYAEEDVGIHPRIDHIKVDKRENTKFMSKEDLADKSSLLLRSNPVHKAVPVLIHNGRPVCESQIIMQYLDEAIAGVGPRLLPVDPYERAVARFWAAFVEDKLLVPWGMVFRAESDEEKAEWTRQTVAAVGKLEEGLRECSGVKGPFFGGERVGYVDVLLGGVVPWVRATEKLSGDRFFDAGEGPMLAAWMERFGELDAAKAVFQDVDALVEYSRALQARLSAAAAATAST